MRPIYITIIAGEVQKMKKRDVNCTEIGFYLFWLARITYLLPVCEFCDILSPIIIIEILPNVVIGHCNVTVCKDYLQEKKKNKQIISFDGNRNSIHTDTRTLIPLLTRKLIWRIFIAFFRNHKKSTRTPKKGSPE